MVVKDLLGVKGTVVFAHTGMVTADDEVGAAEILPEDGMQQGFPGTGIAHIQGIAGLDRGILDKIMFGQGVNGIHPHFGRNVAGFQFAQKLVDQDTVTDLDGDLGQIFMGAVHGVPELQGGHGAPALLLESIRRVSSGRI